MCNNLKYSYKYMNCINIDINSDNILSTNIDYKNINLFLKKYYYIKNEKTSNQKITHTSINKPKGSYIIDSERMPKFLDLYKKAIHANINMYLTEVHLDQGPLIVDIDIKYNVSLNEDKKRIYNYTNIIDLIRIYNKLINKYLKIDENNCYLLEKKEPTIMKIVDQIIYLKDGFHLIYPNICITSNLQYIIRDECIKELSNCVSWNKLNLNNSYEDIIDKNIIKSSNWMMYGSCKPGYENNKYLLTKIISNDLVELEITETERYNLPSKLSIRQSTKDDITEYNEGYNENIINQLYFNINKSFIYKIKNPEDIVYARGLLELLNKDRADNYQSWLEIGFCLHNIDDSLLADWILFSSQSDKYKDGECEKLWIKFKNEGLTIRSLYRWARLDNPEKYYNYIIENTNDIFKNSISGTSYDVAKAFYELYRDVYICASIKHKIWYEFKYNRWIQIDNAYTIFNKLNEEMVNRYLQLSQIYTNKSIVIPEEKDIYLVKIDACIKLCTKLRTTNFKKQIIEELLILFFDPDFLNNLDEQRNLICFTNGVYDLDNNYFREGRPEDKISLCTNINYIKYDNKNELIKKVENFFIEIQPELDMREYILDFMSSCLQGNIPDEKFHIWTGTGCHPKGTLIHCFNKLVAVENIKLNDILYDDNGLKQRVIRLYSGYGIIFKIDNIVDDKIISSYKVNGSHRIAVYIVKSYIIDKKKLSWIEVYNDRIIIRSKYFNNTIDIYEWYLKNCRSYKDKIIAIPVWQYILVTPIWKSNMKGIIKKDKIILTDIQIKYNTFAKYYGFQLDGSQKYFISDNILTYNSNGKSLSINLLSQALGDYSSTLSVSILTNKRPMSNSATPELAKTKGKRFCFIQEPEQNDTIYVGRLKEITSNNDKLQARELYKEPIEFYPQFKLLLACNDLPYIPASDGGTWRRLRVVPFEMKFVDNPKEANERKINRQIKEELINWREALLSILINRFSNYKNRGLIEPSKVVKFTLEYQKESDIYLEFIESLILPTDLKTDKISITDTYKIFKIWYQDVYNIKSTIIQKEFKKNMLIKLPHSTDLRYFTNCKLVNISNQELDI